MFGGTSSSADRIQPAPSAPCPGRTEAFLRPARAFLFASLSPRGSLSAVWQTEIEPAAECSATRGFTAAKASRPTHASLWPLASPRQGGCRNARGSPEVRGFGKSLQACSLSLPNRIFRRPDRKNAPAQQAWICHRRPAVAGAARAKPHGRRSGARKAKARLTNRSDGCARSGIPGGLHASSLAPDTLRGVKRHESGGFESGASGGPALRAIGNAGNSQRPQAHPSLRFFKCAKAKRSSPGGDLRVLPQTPGMPCSPVAVRRRRPDAWTPSRRRPSRQLEVASRPPDPAERTRPGRGRRRRAAARPKRRRRPREFASGKTPQLASACNETLPVAMVFQLA